MHYVERKLLSFCMCIKSGSSYKTMQQIIWKLVLNTFAVTWGNSSSSLSYNHQVSASHSGINMCQCLGFKSTRQLANNFGVLFHIHKRFIIWQLGYPRSWVSLHMGSPLAIVSREENRYCLSAAWKNNRFKNNKKYQEIQIIIWISITE